VPGATPPGKLDGDTLHFLDRDISLDELLSATPNGGWDEFLRYQCSSQAFLNAPGADRAVTRMVLLHTARFLVDGGPAAPLLTHTAPHPTSLRLLAWVKLLSGQAPPELSAGEYELVMQAIAVQVAHLARRIEYETDGNHLIDNAAGLIFGGAWLLSVNAAGTAGWRSGRRALRRGWRLLRAELPKQILPDGGHAEGAPMYHLLVLERLLDVLNLLRHEITAAELGTAHGAAPSVAALRGRARWMLGWARHTAWRDGSFPGMNDWVGGLAPELSDIEAYAKRLGVSLPAEPSELSPPSTPPLQWGETAWDRPCYAAVESGELEARFDCGEIGLAHVPGHAHADSLQILLRHRGVNILADTGTSTYAAGAERNAERGTAAHNTVVYAGRNSSEVWASFRVARRARPVQPVPANARATATSAEEPSGEWWTLEAAGAHNGYARYGLIHERALYLRGPNERLIADELHPAGGLGGLRGRPSRLLTATAYFIVAPEMVDRVTAPEREGDGFVVPVGPLRFRFTRIGELRGPGSPPRLEPCQVAAGYRKRVVTVRIAVPFTGALETHIYEA
jgi:hypothetical protein